MNSVEIVFFIPDKRYDIPYEQLFYINGYVNDGEMAGIPSFDLERFGDQINVYGSIDNLADRLLSLEKIPVICKSYDSKKKRYKVSVYETVNLLEDILDGFEEKKTAADISFQTVSEDEDREDLPDYEGMIEFTITEIRKGQAFGMVSIEGTSYEGRITSGLTKKMNMNGKREKKTVTAKIVGHNQSFYILRT